MTARMFINGTPLPEDPPTKPSHAHTGPCRCIKLPYISPDEIHSFPAQDPLTKKGLTSGSH